MAGAYPMLIAMGAAGGERWLASLPALRSPHYRTCLLHRVWPSAAPMSAPSSFPSRPAARCATSPSDTTAICARRFGWNELVRTVAAIRDSLPPDQQAHLGITTGNYGEYGAIEILGRRLRASRAHRHNQLRMAPRLPNASAHHVHRSRAHARAGRHDLHRLPSRRPQRQLRRSQERREPVPPRHLCLRPAAPALARASGRHTRTSAEGLRHLSIQQAPPRDRPKNRPASTCAGQLADRRLSILPRCELLHQRLRQPAQIRALPAHDKLRLRTAMRRRQSVIHGASRPRLSRDRSVSPRRSAGSAPQRGPQPAKATRSAPHARSPPPHRVRRGQPPPQCQRGPPAGFSRLARWPGECIHSS